MLFSFNIRSSTKEWMKSFAVTDKILSITDKMETFVLIIRERFPSLRLHLHVMVTDCCGTKKS